MDWDDCCASEEGESTNMSEYSMEDEVEEYKFRNSEGYTFEEAWEEH